MKTNHKNSGETIFDLLQTQLFFLRGKVFLNKVWLEIKNTDIIEFSQFK